MSLSRRQQRAIQIREIKNQLLQKIISPVQRTLVSAMCDYFIDVVEKRSQLRLLTTDMETRGQNILTILENIKGKNDDQLIAYVRDYATAQIKSGSHLRENLLTAVATAERELQTRRESNQRMILGFGALLCYLDPTTGISVLSLVAAGHLMGYYSYPSACNKLLEGYEHTDFNQEAKAIQEMGRHLYQDVSNRISRMMR